MTQYAYVNGQVVARDEARVSVFDRGFLFADGIYEVTAVLDGRLVDSAAHLARLARSLGAIGVTLPDLAATIEAIERDLIARNAMREGMVYVQVTRGAAPEREFVAPAGLAPTLVVLTQSRPILDTAAARGGIAVAIVPDLRWARRDIKSVALLAQVLAKQAAADAGCQEAWMVDGETVTEGGSSTAFIVRDNTVITRPDSRDILPGCTRRALQSLAEERQIRIVERPFTVAEAQGADEAFATSATTFVLPVVRVDGRKIGDGTPGPLTRRLREIYIAFARVA